MKNQLKEYCKYLMGRYEELNDHAHGSKLYLEMEQFVEQGRVKDLFEKNTKMESKIEFMHLFRKDILFFAKHSLGKKPNIKKFETWNNLKTTYENSY